MIKIFAFSYTKHFEIDLFLKNVIRALICFIFFCTRFYQRVFLCIMVHNNNKGIVWDIFKPYEMYVHLNRCLCIATTLQCKNCCDSFFILHFRFSYMDAEKFNLSIAVMKLNSSTDDVKANSSNKWRKNQILSVTYIMQPKATQISPNFRNFTAHLKTLDCNFYSSCVGI